MTTFAQLVEEAGGPTKLAEASGVSRPHLANIAARRKRLTPDVMAILRPLFPSVDEATWLGLLLVQVDEPSSDATAPTESDSAAA